MKKKNCSDWCSLTFILLVLSIGGIIFMPMKKQQV